MFLRKVKNTSRHYKIHPIRKRLIQLNLWMKQTTTIIICLDLKLPQKWEPNKTFIHLIRSIIYFLSNHLKTSQQIKINIINSNNIVVYLIKGNNCLHSKLH
jgi:hypothetical protein